MSAQTDADAAEAALAAAAASGIQTATVDGQTTQRFTLADMVAAKKFLANQVEPPVGRRGLRMNRMIPGGTE